MDLLGSILGSMDKPPSASEKEKKLAKGSIYIYNYKEGTVGYFQLIAKYPLQQSRQSKRKKKNSKGGKEIHSKLKYVHVYHWLYPCSIKVCACSYSVIDIPSVKIVLCETQCLHILEFNRSKSRLQSFSMILKRDD